MKRLMTESGRRIVGVFNDGLMALTLNTAAMTSNSGGSKIDYTLQDHTGSVASTATSAIDRIQTVLAGPAGWVVLILTTIALLAGLGIIYLLTRPKLGPLPRSDTRSKRVRMYNPAAPDDPMSPFAPKRGLG
jgi:hypothetical protein